MRAVLPVFSDDTFIIGLGDFDAFTESSDSAGDFFDKLAIGSTPTELRGHIKLVTFICTLRIGAQIKNSALDISAISATGM